MLQVPTVTVKLAGAIMLGFGIGASVLIAWLVERHYALHRAGAISDVVILAVLVTLAIFCSLIGYRLLFNRPNRHGSSLPPLAWRILAGIFWISGLAFTWFVFTRGELSGLFAIACLGALGYGLPTSTREEAARIADSIAMEAREKNYPLVCRAVCAARPDSCGP